MGLIDIAMKNQLVSENYRNEFLLIASTIIFQLILGTWKITYLPLMRLRKEIQFILVVHLIFLGSDSPYIEVRNIFDINLNSASLFVYALVTSNIGSKNTAKKRI